jgi:hypothetical protein
MMREWLSRLVTRAFLPIAQSGVMGGLPEARFRVTGAATVDQVITGSGYVQAFSSYGVYTVSVTRRMGITFQGVGLGEGGAYGGTDTNGARGGRGAGYVVADYELEPNYTYTLIVGDASNSFGASMVRNDGINIGTAQSGTDGGGWSSAVGGTGITGGMYGLGGTFNSVAPGGSPGATNGGTGGGGGGGTGGSAHNGGGGAGGGMTNGTPDFGFGTPSCGDWGGRGIGIDLGWGEIGYGGGGGYSCHSGSGSGGAGLGGGNGGARIVITGLR